LNAIRELLHWLVDRVEASIEDRAAAHGLVDRVEASIEDRAAAHGLVDEARPAEPAAGGAEAAAEPPADPEGGSE
jgi:hypothetical protein